MRRIFWSCFEPRSSMQIHWTKALGTLFQVHLVGKVQSTKELHRCSYGSTDDQNCQSFSWFGMLSLIHVDRTTLFAAETQGWNVSSMTFRCFARAQPWKRRLNKVDETKKNITHSLFSRSSSKVYKIHQTILKRSSFWDEMILFVHQVSAIENWFQRFECGRIWGPYRGESGFIFNSVRSLSLSVMPQVPIW